MSKIMLINHVENHECRIAILLNNRLEELYMERAADTSQVGNIFKGRVTNIEPSIQAAFVDFGGDKNGFLHISDLHPKFFPTNSKASKNTEAVGRRTAHRTRPTIQECLKRGQEVVVQMTKQGIGTKGPTLTTYLSIPGRLMVAMPEMTHVGISRKIEDEDQRMKIRKILDQITIPKDMGVIVRTAGIDRAKRDLQNDLSYLVRLWKTVEKRTAEVKAPAEIYQESDLVIRTIRDVFDSDIERIVCDNKAVATRVEEFFRLAMPRTKRTIEYYQGQRGLFERFGVEEEIQKVHARKVELDNGGSLVIDQTEALVAIDVNSGSFRAHKDAETNASNLNIAAAEEIGRQLRLRDMGGVIIIDFVDMREEKNRRNLEKKLRMVLKKDRAKSKVLRISSFGIVEMTRQRLRPSLRQSVYVCCEHCDGTGHVMSQASVALKVMRELSGICENDKVVGIDIHAAPSVAHHLLNNQRKVIAELEENSGKKIVVSSDPECRIDDVNFIATNNRGTEIAWNTPAASKSGKADNELIDIKNSSGKAPKQAEKSQETPESKEKEEKDTPAQKSRRRGRRGGRKRRKKPSDNIVENSENNSGPNATSPNDSEQALPQTPSTPQQEQAE